MVEQSGLEKLFSVARGPHPMAKAPAVIALVHKDIDYQVKVGFTEVVLFSTGGSSQQKGTMNVARIPGFAIDEFPTWLSQVLLLGRGYSDLSRWLNHGFRVLDQALGYQGSDFGTTRHSGP